MTPYIPPHRRLLNASENGNLTSKVLTSKVSESPVPRTLPLQLEANVRMSLLDISTYFQRVGDTEATNGSSTIGSTTVTSTLNDAAKLPGKLAYILVFPFGHPKWKSHKVLYAKSSLQLLPEYEEHMANIHPVSLTDDEPLPAAGIGHDEMKQDTALPKASTKVCGNQSPSVPSGQALEGRVGDEIPAIGQRLPVKVSGDRGSTIPSEKPVAGQVHGERNDAKGPPPGRPDTTAFERTQPRIRYIERLHYTPALSNPVAVFETQENQRQSFRFTGWFEVVSIGLIAPYSTDLARLLQEKWDSTSVRKPSAWAADLARKWATVQLQPLTKGCPPDPMI